MKLSHKILSLFMIAMIFIASTGMTLNLHFCANELKTVSLQQTESCCQKKSGEKKENHKECNKNGQKHCDGKSGKSCCKESKVATKNPVKVDNPSSKKESSFAQSLVFLKSYVLSFLNFNTEDSEDDEKPEVSLFPMLKEGLYILLGQFRN
ncbi:hypothetical protein Pedsa_0678 [Pseudopedobacter saltans DSM 12145]|uniref:Uncharacterized protein n=1 Tax=Pseudopedobacter saltans (strain ATCC 51119 / DSM 12145 / JCM 21818 / CCUG 39354 / LMG 10337 / NBRC 100064 / NCIMB 13643) TaxID=762903 RepID=F0S833_PSESL|nr:hypothetical protein [Pseudopedobacter saltans]ADY51254.1 hypothetical protein Pedsa_0678 [Pseudopedobacter saltans DSM 12145]